MKSKISKVIYITKFARIRTVNTASTVCELSSQARLRRYLILHIMRHNNDILMLLAVAHKILINNRNDAQVQPDDLQCQFGRIHLGWATFRAMRLKVAGERTAVLPNIAEIQGVAVRC